jgi:hypothetical protein
MTMQILLLHLAVFYSMNPAAHAQATPEIFIDPLSHTSEKMDETFNITVNIRNLESSQRLVVAQFRVIYNSTLLEASDVKEGPFMQQFNNTASPPYTTFINYTENDPLWGPNVLVGIVLLPTPVSGGGVWTNFPQGNGTLATITFKTIYQPSWTQPSITSDLRLNNTLLVANVNQTVGTIPHTDTNGTYEVQPPSFTYEPTEPSAGEVTIFKVTEPENHAPLIYSWNFGDGITKNTTEPTIDHAFPSGGQYNVSLTCIMNDTEATVAETVAVESYIPLSVTAEVGSLHFKGETAEFTILTTDSGKPVNATSLKTKLYFNGTLINDLSGTIESVDTGCYMIPYNIPSDAKPGEYTLLVEAEYYGASGATIAKFTISPTLTGLITEIQNGIATISNGITNLSLNLTAMNATLTGLVVDNGQVLARIDTTAGALTTKLDTINATIGNVNGNTVTLSSMLGNITTKLDGIQSTATTTMYAASVLSAIAVILALVILVFVRKK